MYAKGDKHESQNIHKSVDLKCPLRISNRQNSGSGFIHAVSSAASKDICAALAKAPNQLLGGNSLVRLLIATHNVGFLLSAG